MMMMMRVLYYYLLCTHTTHQMHLSQVNVITEYVIRIVCST